MDVVVTLPKSFGLARWIEEGDAAGEPETGVPYFWSVPRVPKIITDERVYVVYKRHLIGYAPLIEVRDAFSFAYLVRGGGAVAVTIDEDIPGFRGYRYRWWDHADEIPFPEWKELA